jgi:hypothetical protein
MKRRKRTPDLRITTSARHRIALVWPGTKKGRTFVRRSMADFPDIGPGKLVYTGASWKRDPKKSLAAVELLALALGLRFVRERA